MNRNKLPAISIIISALSRFYFNIPFTAIEFMLYASRGERKGWKWLSPYAHKLNTCPLNSILTLAGLGSILWYEIIVVMFPSQLSCKMVRPHPPPLPFTGSWFYLIFIVCFIERVLLPVGHIRLKTNFNQFYLVKIVLFFIYFVY